MTDEADRAIEALRAVHDDLVGRVSGYADADLTRPSGASDWTVAQVLSHLGSGAEIAHAGLTAAAAGSPYPEPSFNESVWDRWNAMTPRQQADGCVASDASLVDAYEGLDHGTRDSLQAKLPFLPEPVGADGLAALRLNESALHGWDVAVADDSAALLHPLAAPVLLDALSGPLSMFFGFLGKPVGIDATLAVHTTEPARQLTLKVGEAVSLRPSAPDTPDGRLTLPAEAFVRLLGGRLGTDHTPAGVVVCGPLSLADLRAAFPGF